VRTTDAWAARLGEARRTGDDREEQSVSEGHGHARHRRRVSRIGPTGARFPRPTDGDRTEDAEQTPPESTRTRVRPYVRTRGRTRTRVELAVETLVSIPSPRPPLEDPEHVALGDVVGAPRSVAEVAAMLAVPLGVARVIIDDMAGAGLLVVHPRSLAPSGTPSRDMMQRVLDGLHRL
jgi:hypothetical protein